MEGGHAHCSLAHCCAENVLEDKFSSVPAFCTSLGDLVTLALLLLD